MTKSEAPLAVIVPVRGNNGLGALRSLSAEGVRCLGISLGPLTANGFSRSCRTIRLPDPAHDEPRFLEGLLRIGRDAESRPVLFPMNDLCVMQLAKHRSVLEPLFRHAFMEWEDYACLATKAGMYHRANACGVPTPAWQQLFEDSAPREIASRLRYPVLLKPVRHFELDGRQQVRDSFGFFRRYGKALEVPDADMLLKRYQEVREAGFACLVQEMIPGGAEHLYTLAFYADPSSEVIAGFVGRKLRQYPGDFGTVTIGESRWDEDVAELGARFIKASNYRGIGNIEFKRDPRDGQLRLMELNLRAGSFISLPTASGVNLIHFAYRHLIGDPIPATRQRDGVLWVDILRDFLEIRAQRRRSGSPAWLALLAYRSHPHVHAVFSWKDPMPFLLTPFQIPRTQA
jgi:predicted ATP-grasp superfamily ATP-dependent carboligase